MKRNRNKKGLCLVEYALGLGCIAGTCLCAFSTLGFNAGELCHDFSKCVNWSNSCDKGHDCIRFCDQEWKKG